jgi:hypothetical protein
MTSGTAVADITPVAVYRKAEVAADDEILDDDAVLMWVVPVETVGEWQWCRTHEYLGSVSDMCDTTTAVVVVFDD